MMYSTFKVLLKILRYVPYILTNIPVIKTEHIFQLYLH